MFRQRLKGGHRVGASTTGAAQNTSSNLRAQNQNISPIAQSNLVSDESWNWEVPPNGFDSEDKLQKNSMSQNSTDPTPFGNTITANSISQYSAASNVHGNAPMHNTPHHYQTDTSFGVSRQSASSINDFQSFSDWSWGEGDGVNGGGWEYMSPDSAPVANQQVDSSSQFYTRNYASNANYVPPMSVSQSYNFNPYNSSAEYSLPMSDSEVTINNNQNQPLGSDAAPSQSVANVPTTIVQGASYPQLPNLGNLHIAEDSLNSNQQNWGEDGWSNNWEMEQPNYFHQFSESQNYATTNSCSDAIYTSQSDSTSHNVVHAYHKEDVSSLDYSIIERDKNALHPSQDNPIQENLVEPKDDNSHLDIPSFEHHIPTTFTSDDVDFTSSNNSNFLAVVDSSDTHGNYPSPEDQQDITENQPRSGTVFESSECVTVNDQQNTFCTEESDGNVLVGGESVASDEVTTCHQMTNDHISDMNENLQSSIPSQYFELEKGSIVPSGATEQSPHLKSFEQAYMGDLSDDDTSCSNVQYSYNTDPNTRNTSSFISDPSFSGPVGSVYEIHPRQGSPFQPPKNQHTLERPDENIRSASPLRHAPSVSVHSKEILGLENDLQGNALSISANIEQSCTSSMSEDSVTPKIAAGSNVVDIPISTGLPQKSDLAEDGQTTEILDNYSDSNRDYCSGNVPSYYNSSNNSKTDPSHSIRVKDFNLDNGSFPHYLEREKGDVMNRADELISGASGHQTFATSQSYGNDGEQKVGDRTRDMTAMDKRQVTRQGESEGVLGHEEASVSRKNREKGIDVIHENKEDGRREGLELMYNTTVLGVEKQKTDPSPSDSPQGQSSQSVVSPNFSRMVPGESTKGESAAFAPAATYLPPSVVPAMPSERVVTGNDNPRPIPNARAAPQDSNSDVRSPPDGPDTAGVAADAITGVVPPVRSETIGSEKIHDGNGKAANQQEINRDRNSMERVERNFYSDRYDQPPYHGDPQRDHRDYYHPDYESRRTRREHRRHNQTLGDSEDEEHHRYGKAPGGDSRDSRYDSREDYDYYRKRNREDRRRRDHYYYPYGPEDDRHSYERRSDRSPPLSRTSSYGNLNDSVLNQQMSERDYSRYKKSVRPEHYSKGYPPYQHGYGPREMYDPQAYYYYYQNYQKMMEQHPYYRDYYRQFYGRYGAGDVSADDKNSIRSGRSSINDEMKKSTMSSLPPYDPYNQYYGQPNSADMGRFFGQSHQFSVRGPPEPSPGYSEHESFCYNSLPADTNSLHITTDESVSTRLPTHRSTPKLFSRPHLRATFTPGGGLLLILPNDPKAGEKPVVQVRNVREMLSIDRDYAHRISKFKTYPGPFTSTETHKDILVKYCEEKSSSALMSHDLFDKESVSLLWDFLALMVKQNGLVSGGDLAGLLVKNYNVKKSSSEYSLSTLVPSGCLQNEDEQPTEDIKQDSSDPKVLSVFPHDERQLVATFSDYLCLGRKKEAVDLAIQNGLWGYAMTLASKMDPMTTARVTSSFVNSIPSNDVLQTLIQHLSGKKPEVSKNYNPDKWGDWRRHLAMLVANSTGNSERDRASIVALGDSLASRDMIHASHVCYLAAGEEFGSPFDEKSPRLVLLGVSTRYIFQTSLKNDDAVRCTEIYEYARNLATTNLILMPSFQFFKFIYATQLAQSGFPSEALKYCEVVYRTMCSQPEVFDPHFCSHVLDLASQLKYNDIHYQVGEGELSDMGDPEWLQHFQLLVRSLVEYSQNEGHAVDVGGGGSSSYIDDGYDQGTTNYVGLDQTGGLVTENDNVHGGQTSAVVDGDAIGGLQMSTETQQDPENQIPFYNPERFTSDQNLYGDLSRVDNSIPESNQCPPQTDENLQSMNFTQALPSWHQPQPYWQPDPTPQSHTPESPSYSQPDSPQSYDASLPPSMGVDQQVYRSVETVKSEPLEQVENSSSVQTQEEKEYWAMMSGKSKEPKVEPSERVAASSKSSSSNEASAKALSDSSEDKKPQGGFLGSLFGGWRKGRNEAKLPDDTNPTIVWDEDKKKWVNTDEEEAEETPLGPPPIDPVGKGMPPSQLGAFKGAAMKRSRYIDPVGATGRVSSGVIPGPMGATVPPLNDFASAPGASSATPHNPTTPQAHLIGAGYSGNPVVAATTIQAPMEREPAVDHRTVSSPSEGPSPPPLFFNPSQFQPTGSIAPKSGSKRLGPARRTFNMN